MAIIMNDLQDSISTTFSSDKFEENRALIPDFEQQIRTSMEAVVAENIITTFHVLRNMLDLELVVALRNSIGYLQSAGVVDAKRINEVLLNANKDTLTVFQRGRKANIVETITARAEKSKAMLAVIQPIESFTN
jgi:hypothetical protein